MGEERRLCARARFRGGGQMQAFAGECARRREAAEVRNQQDVTVNSPSIPAVATEDKVRSSRFEKPA